MSASARKHGWTALWIAPLAAGASGCSANDVVAVSAVQDCTEEGSCGPAADCAPAACTTASAPLCERASVPAQVGDGCTQTGAPPSFRFALCSCTDLVSAHAITLSAHDTQPGPADLGVNGELWTSASLTVDGSLELSSPLMLDPQSLTVGGSLLERADPPCDCAEDALFDPGPFVSEVRDDHDDATLGMSPTDLSGDQSETQLALSCGRYFFERIAGTAALSIVVQEPALLVVAEDLQLDGDLSIQVATGASFVMVVGGNIRLGGAVTLQGQDGDLAQSMLMVGGNGTLQLQSPARLEGIVYAPRAELVTQDALSLTGTLFVRRAAPGADLTLQSAPQLAQAFACAADP